MFNQKYPLNIAHRGGSLEGPENTLFTFQQGLDNGSHAIETDVHLTQDEIPVIIHNETVDETTNGTGFIRNYPFEHLKGLDAGYWFTPDHGAHYPFRGQGITIPSLEEAFQLFPDTIITIDIKIPSKPLIQKVFHLVREYNRMDKTIIGSISWKTWRILYQTVNTEGYTLFFSPQQVLKLVILNSLQLTHYFQPMQQVLSLPTRISFINFLSHQFLSNVKKLGIPIFFWTINNQDEMRQLINLAVTGIITDSPKKLSQILKSNTGYFTESFSRTKL